MDDTNQFFTGKLFPMILKYSIPAAISLLITAIYNIVDRIFVGNCNGTSALAGLSICFPLILHDDGLWTHLQRRRCIAVQPVCRPSRTEKHEPLLWQRPVPGDPL